MKSPIGFVSKNPYRFEPHDCSDTFEDHDELKLRIVPDLAAKEPLKKQAYLVTARATYRSCSLVSALSVLLDAAKAKQPNTTPYKDYDTRATSVARFRLASAYQDYD